METSWFDIALEIGIKVATGLGLLMLTVAMAWGVWMAGRMFYKSLKGG